MDLVNPNVNISIVLPEMIVALCGVIVMLYDSFFPKQRKVTGTLSLLGLAVAAVLLGMMWSADSGVPATAFGGMVAHDSLRLGFSFVFLLVSALTILISTIWTDREDVPVGEYHALLM